MISVWKEVILIFIISLTFFSSGYISLRIFFLYHFWILSAGCWLLLQSFVLVYHSREAKSDMQPYVATCSLQLQVGFLGQKKNSTEKSFISVLNICI